jgi:hypothetical protein
MTSITKNALLNIPAMLCRVDHKGDDSNELVARVPPSQLEFLRALILLHNPGRTCIDTAGILTLHHPRQRKARRTHIDFVAQQSSSNKAKDHSSTNTRT